MITLHIPDMRCAHCLGGITKTIKELDANATLDVDLPAHRAVLGTRTDTASVVHALADAGYLATRAQS